MYTVIFNDVNNTAYEVTHKSFLEDNSVFRQYSNVAHHNILISLVP